MKIKLILDDKAYGLDYLRTGFDAQTKAAEIATLIQQTVLHHLGESSRSKRLMEEGRDD